MTFSEDLRVRVANHYLQGDVAMRKVAEIPNVSLGFVHNVVACHRQFGQGTNSYPYRMCINIANSRRMIACETSCVKSLVYSTGAMGRVRRWRSVSQRCPSNPNPVRWRSSHSVLVIILSNLSLAKIRGCHLVECSTDAIFGTVRWVCKFDLRDSPSVRPRQRVRCPAALFIPGSPPER
ncbi:hypothetical protein BDM02DRAFT_485142 [Thelephora ganbajun]|uniref:Uncharacterized protein n=1 Tax=Thelephora ganbajun TaxID=370292 RepID=A0ACB6Z7D0_THEGA|nr:hypothetical protein BDM02DRAFT_485142 [Thelephora ganbajun]